MSHNHAKGSDCQYCKRLEQLLIDPGFGVAIAGLTLIRIEELPADTYVDAVIADIDDLKQLNTACGNQPRANDLIRPALQIVAPFSIVIGRGDGGDQFLFIFPAGHADQAIHRMQAELARAPMTDSERSTLRVERAKKYGIQPDQAPANITMTFAGIHNIPGHLASAALRKAESALFQAKAANNRDGLFIVEPPLQEIERGRD